MVDLNNVIELTLEHRRRVVTAAALSIYAWKIKVIGLACAMKTAEKQVLKIKMIFHTLNMLCIDVTQKVNLCRF